jgi:hypothetical protein
MPIIELTGSGQSRIREIQERWIVAEPSSNYKLYQNPLYTVPVGQTFAAEMVINTGSVSFESGTLYINKDIHVFESEMEADSFISEIGLDNIASISERYALRPDATSYIITEIQLINYPQAKFSFDMLNLNVQRGFKVEIFASGSNGLYEIEKKAIFNANGDLISDTFLKYFEVEVDTNE